MAVKKYEGDMGKQLRSTEFNRAYYEEHRDAGLDYMNHGGWQDGYGTWFVEALELHGKHLLDVGCACGSLVLGFAHAGALVSGIEVNRHMIELAHTDLRRRTVVSYGDAADIPFGDGAFDCVHSAQVAEHFKPEQVPQILREHYRVLKPGGLFFCCLDTEELYARQGRKVENEDPTHWCVKPMTWWYDLLVAAGFVVLDPGDMRCERLVQHPQSYMKHYDWDWFLCEKR